MSYWYVGSPYSKYPAGTLEAFRKACVETARLMNAGVPVFCPISHSHSVAVNGGLPLKDHAFWMGVDKPMVDAAIGMIILTMEGWEESAGLQQEIEWFRAAGKPILYLDPGSSVSSLEDLSSTPTAPSLPQQGPSDMERRRLA